MGFYQYLSQLEQVRETYGEGADWQQLALDVALLERKGQEQEKSSSKARRR